VRRLPALDANLRDVSRRYAAAVEVITEKEMQVRPPLNQGAQSPVCVCDSNSHVLCPIFFSIGRVCSCKS
jgi:hypothetical protein